MKSYLITTLVLLSVIISVQAQLAFSTPPVNKSTGKTGNAAVQVPSATKVIKVINTVVRRHNGVDHRLSNMKLNRLQAAPLPANHKLQNNLTPTPVIVAKHDGAHEWPPTLVGAKPTPTPPSSNQHNRMVHRHNAVIHSRPVPVTMSKTRHQ
ncbi:hypothetical protein BDF22DRAFT_697183 [Syncephalis plumigaleata]|nr:hypothetical protein BDF22DRAFT_697183 [Syncephalis plumigaleata]